VAGQLGALAVGVPLLAAAAPAWTGLATEPGRGRGWYVNGQGQTLTVVESPRPFLMGAPDGERGRYGTETSHWRRIDRRYALATKPVTVAQFRRFLKAHPEVGHEYAKRFSPEDDCPIIGVTWYEAAQYCRWLSEQEGFAEQDMVYPGVAEIEACKQGKAPLRLPANYLKRRGYRLPTEAEWECANRAGALTSRPYGSSEDLLPRYAWNLFNAQDRTWPVGQKRPNDLGLFDALGHVRSWCQDRAGPYPAGSRERPAGDGEDEREITITASRVLRGASFSAHPPDQRAAYRSTYGPAVRYITVGFRVARTCD
jgi:formylglycine-generating enzyme required for sulfatase activity